MENLIEKAADAYYTGNPIMSDEEFDLLVDELRKTDPNNPVLLKVGSRPMGKVYKHSIPAGSQEKLKDRKAYDRWIQTTAKFGCKGYVLGYKLDGSTVVLDYENGKLIRALSRGDGIQGSDITATVLQMKNVKRNLQDSFTGSLRGEIILPKSLFNKYFKPLGYTNPRNSAAGVSSDQKGTKLCKYLKVIYFDCIGNDGGITEEEKLLYVVNKLKLEVVITEFFDDADKMWDSWLKMAGKRESLDYEIDGVVVRVNEIEIQNRMGSTADLRPKGQRCIKFEAQGAISELLSVELSIGSNGAIVPTGKLKPIQIGGVTVSSALLANFNEIKRLGIAVGDTVYVTRRGDVIPKIENVIFRPKNRKEIKIPEKCIVCGQPTEMIGAYLLCTNEFCIGTEFRRLLSYVNKRNIKFLGEGTLAELYENHGIKTSPDLYNLTVEQLSKANRGQGVVGQGAVAIIDEINKSRTIQLKELLGCLSIPMLGRRQTEIMMELGIDTLDKFLDLTIEELVKLPGFKDAKAKTIINGIKAARPMIGKMNSILTLVEPIKEEKLMATGNKLAGKQFCFTGAIERCDQSGKRFTRDMMHAMVMENGGSVTDKVTKTTILVQADPSSSSSKSKKAVQVGAVIMAERDFWQLIS